MKKLPKTAEEWNKAIDDIINALLDDLKTKTVDLPEQKKEGS